jgi:hypothetical protein
MIKKDNLFKLTQEVYNSVAWKVYTRLRTLRINFFVFQRNYQELKKILEAVKEPEQIEKILDSSARQNLDVVSNEVIRLLHNYLASAKSLVDVTRVLITDWYQGSDFIKEYKTQVDSRFVNNSLIGFIEELRNFSLHYSFPITIAKISTHLGENTLDFSFVLSKSSLISWSKWTSKGKPFLDSIRDEIEVGVLVDAYYREIFEFYSWMEKRLREIHSEELNWLSEMNKRMNNLIPITRGLGKQ